MKPMPWTEHKPGYRAAPTASQSPVVADSQSDCGVLGSAATRSDPLAHHENLTTFASASELLARAVFVALLADALRRRFEERVRKTNGCWLWRGHLNSSGYGRFKFVGGEAKAHRVGYELFVGPIPDGLVLDHLCRNTWCVNPAHLEPVTGAENTLRGFGAAAINARKTHCNKGHPLSGSNLKIYVDSAGEHRRCLTCKRAWAESASVGVSP